MAERIRSSAWIGSAAAGGIGVFLLYWGIHGVISTTYVPAVTVPWLDRTLAAVNQTVWLLALGVFLLVVGATPFVSQWIRENRIARVAVTIAGAGVLLAGAALAAITLNPIGGVLYVFPLLLTGVLLLSVVIRSSSRRPSAAA